MAIEVMMRHENKYLVDGEKYSKLQSRLSQYMELDVYNKQSELYTISNIYYDTDDNNLVRASISKPGYKEKLRVRAYGAPARADMVFVEIKKKYDGVVIKRRCAFALSEAYEFLESHNIEPKEYMNAQVLKEIDYFIRLHAPKPKLYLAYERRAYVGENDLRVTFDTNVRTRRHDLRLEKGSYGDKLLDDDVWLVEIKTNGAIPLWLTEILSELRIYSQGYSKYGEEYQRRLEMERTGGCLDLYSMSQMKLQPSRCKVFLPRLA